MRRRLLLMLLTVSLPVFAQAPDETGLVPLSERLQDSYAQTSPQGFLIDPQRLLRGGEVKERREFLRYHSSDSLIDLYVVLFKGEQKLFNSADLSGHLLNIRPDAKPAVLVHYFMGRPDRSELHLSAELTEIVPQEEMDRALSNAIERAKSGVSPMDELEKFMVQTSIRIYRIERLLSEGTASPAPLQVDEAKEVEQREGEAFVQQLIAFWSEQKFKIIGSLVLGLVFILLQRWRNQHVSYQFPDSEAVERLGGAHGAGVGAVIEFGKSSLPPAAQLEKLKLH